MARLHWFWRAAIAVGVSGGVGRLLGHRWVRFLSGGCPVDDFFDSLLGHELSDPFLVAVLMLMIASGVFVFLGYWPARHIGILPGHCRKCSYDLTGNVSGICPECGEKTSTEHPA